VLDHPNVVKAIEYCGTGPYPFLVMEFVDGESFGQRVERKGPYPEAEAIRLIAQVCEGLHRAHKQGLVHRDVKPDNILVTREGVAKLTDMGLVKDVDGDLNLTKTGRGLGTPHYMAPEQFRNAKGVDVRGDIYSLGATLYAMVTGQVPFENASPLDCWMKKIRNEFPSPKDIAPHLADEPDDWRILIGLATRGDVDGFITNDDDMLELPEEMVALSRTRLTLVVTAGVGHNPLRASGLLMAYLPEIARRLGNESPRRATIYRLRGARMGDFLTSPAGERVGRPTESPASAVYL